MEKIKLTQAQIDAIDKALSHYGDADYLVTMHQNVINNGHEWSMWNALNELSVTALSHALKYGCEAIDTSKVLFTAKQEYKMYLLLRQRSHKWIRDYLKFSQKVYDLPKAKVLKAMEWGYAIRPGSVKIKEFRDIQLGMLLMEKGSNEQHRIDSWNSISATVGVCTVGYPEEMKRYFHSKDYGKTWCIVGDRYDDSGGELYYLRKPNREGSHKVHPIVALVQKEKQQELSKQALELDLDYELASLHDAMKQGNQTEVEHCKQRLAEIQKEMESNK